MGDSATEPRKRVVFYVDDQDFLRRFVSKQLQKRGFEVLLAGSAAEALEVMEAYRGPIDALLMDINLPDGWGSVLAQRLRGERAGMAVVYTTGFAASDPILSGGLRDAPFVLHKPFSADELVRILTLAIEEYRDPE